MKYTIFGFNQEELIKYGLNLSDTAILRCMLDIIPSSKVITMYVKQRDNQLYYCIHHKAIMKDYPIMGINNVKIIGRHIKKLIDLNIIDQYIHRSIKGTYTYYRMMPLVYDNLIYKEPSGDDCTAPTGDQPRHHPVPPNNPSTIYPSTNNPITTLSSQSDERTIGTQLVSEEIKIGEVTNSHEDCWKFLYKEITLKQGLKPTKQEIFIIKNICVRLDNNLDLIQTIWSYMVQDEFWMDKVSVRSISNNLPKLRLKALEIMGGF